MLIAYIQTIGEEIEQLTTKVSAMSKNWDDRVFAQIEEACVDDMLKQSNEFYNTAYPLSISLRERMNALEQLANKY